MGKTRIIQRFLREHDSYFDEVRGTARLPVAAIQMQNTVAKKGAGQENVDSDYSLDRWGRPGRTI